MRALRKGLIDYDLRHGYRGALTKWNSADLEADEKKLDALKSIEASQDIIPALITEVEDDQVTAFTKSAEQIVIPWEQMNWARRYELSLIHISEPTRPY